MKIILSSLYDNFIQNKYLIEELSLNEELKVGGVEGSFPFSYYKNNINTNSAKDLALYPAMEGCLNKYRNMDIILFDFSNPILEPKDYHSRLCKIHMESFASYENVFFIVSQIEFIKYLKGLYPGVKIILDMDYCSGDIQEVSDIIYGQISWDTQKLSIGMKIVRIPIYTCKKCSQYERCLKSDVKSIMDFSEESCFITCTSKKLETWDYIQQNIDKAKENNADYVLLESPKEPQELYYDFIMNGLKGEINND